jgi:hypothetical protein
MYKQGKSGIKNEINCQIHVRKDVAICFILNKVLLYECYKKSEESNSWQ